MPQVTCPNCGMTINLQNRKEIDVNLIVNAAKRPKTFTELLRITKLPRKTLNMRLRELCHNGTIVKADGVYRLNGALESEFGNNGGGSMVKFKEIFHNVRTKTSLMLLVLLLCSSTSGLALATFLALPKPVDQEPIALGNLTVTLDISNVNDLYAWQALIVYNSSSLKVVEILPGDFVGTEYPSLNSTDISNGILLSATDIGDDVLLLGGTLLGSTPGKNGNGSLATIIFEYFVEEPQEPILVFDDARYPTLLANSAGFIFPIEDPTELTLTISH
jgi:hypothetical protein